jgi:hypothetical protein
VTARTDGFANAHVEPIARAVPTLALAVKAAALARMTGTLMETYLGRDAGRRVLRTLRTITESHSAVVCRSDSRWDSGSGRTGVRRSDDRRGRHPAAMGGTRSGYCSGCPKDTPSNNCYDFDGWRGLIV